MKLVNEKGMPVFKGDTVSKSDGTLCKVTSIQEPHKPSSTGKVYVEEIESGWQQGFYPNVFKLEWVGRKDQN